MNNNQEIKFEIFRPININEIFTIPEDRSLWNDEPRYLRTNGGQVPNRVPYLNTSKLLIPQNEHIKDFFGGNSPTNYGIYILIFNDFKKFYVGIAARYSYMKGEERVEIQTPEGFLTRLRKHRAKCTGTFANINHTNQAPYGWRDFALDRNKLYCAKNVIDTMSDCLLSLVVFNNHENYKIDDKGILEKLEHHISESGISEYFGEEFKDYESFAHTRPQSLDFVPVFKYRDFVFRNSFTNEIQGGDNDLEQNRQNKSTVKSNVNDVQTFNGENFCEGETVIVGGVDENKKANVSGQHTQECLEKISDHQIMEKLACLKGNLVKHGIRTSEPDISNPQDPTVWLEVNERLKIQIKLNLSGKKITLNYRPSSPEHYDYFIKLMDDLGLKVSKPKDKRDCYAAFAETKAKGKGGEGRNITYKDVDELVEILKDNM